MVWSEQEAWAGPLKRPCFRILHPETHGRIGALLANCHFAFRTLATPTEATATGLVGEELEA